MVAHRCSARNDEIRSPSRYPTPDLMIHRLIRANNAVWAALYYDELVDTSDYQLTFMEGADAGYYNCAQAVSRADDDVVSAIESFYTTRGLPPAVYLDPESAPGLQSLLAAAGYAEVPDEQEHCYVFDLHAGVVAPPPATALHVPAGRVRAVKLGGPDDPLLPAFLDVDATANALPDRVRRKLEHKLRSPVANVEVCCLLALLDGQPASSCVVGLVGEYALFAEAGTLPAFRRLGLSSWLTLEGLALAQRSGARFAFLTAGAGAASNVMVHKLGLRRLCTRTYMQRRLV